MLSTKTLYAIYLLHQAGDLCSADMRLSRLPENALERSRYMDVLRLRGYLSSVGSITRDLSKSSLSSLLYRLGELIDPLSLSKEEKAVFPRNLRQFNRCYKLWQATLM